MDFRLGRSFDFSVAARLVARIVALSTCSGCRPGR